MAQEAPQFTYAELQILWHLKNNGGYIEKAPSKTGKGQFARESLINTLADAINVRLQVVKHCLRELEQRCIILRSYSGTKPDTLRGGYIVCLKIELLDPNMYLPPIKTKPLAVVVARENEDLYERTAAPEDSLSADAIVEALLNRVNELQQQVNKLQDIVEDQAKIILKEKDDRHANRAFRESLTNRVRDALTPEQWDALRHPQRKSPEGR